MGPSHASVSPDGRMRHRHRNGSEARKAPWVSPNASCVGVIAIPMDRSNACDAPGGSMRCRRQNDMSPASDAFVGLIRTFRSKHRTISDGASDACNEVITCMRQPDGCMRQRDGCMRQPDGRVAGLRPWRFRPEPAGVEQPFRAALGGAARKGCSTPKPSRRTAAAESWWPARVEVRCMRGWEQRSSGGSALRSLSAARGVAVATTNEEPGGSDLQPPRRDLRT